MSSKFDETIIKMKASFADIEASKTRTVVLEHYIPVKNAGKAGSVTKTVTKTVAKIVAKPVAEKPVAEYTKKPEGVQGVVAEEVTRKSAKKPVAKKSKLNKLLRGKTIYDFSA